jgi:hypothetical protein
MACSYDIWQPFTGNAPRVLAPGVGHGPCGTWLLGSGSQESRLGVARVSLDSDTFMLPLDSDTGKFLLPLASDSQTLMLPLERTLASSCCLFIWNPDHLVVLVCTGTYLIHHLLQLKV